MLQSSIFRNLAKLLLALLIVAFVFWGFGDAFRRKDANYAIKIGDIEYSYPQWNKIVSNNIKERKIRYGKELSAQEIIALRQYLANKIIDSALLYIEARNLGIVVDDNMVKKEILKIPVFFKNGKFNKDLFDQTIQSYGLSEEAFIREIKEELIRNIFINSLATNKLTIPELTKIILQDILESREIELIKIPFKAFKATSAIPKKEELKKIYAQNKNDFKVSEKRNINYIVISSENIKDRSKKVDEQELYNIYKQKSFLFVEPEKRTVKQIQFDSLDTAKKARTDLIKGADFAMIAKKYSPNFKKTDLGTITNKDFEGEISTKLFKLSEGEISDIIETPLGPYLFKITRIIPSKVKKYNEVKELIQNEYLKEVQFDKFLILVKEIQAKLKEGKNIETIAKSYDLKIEQAEISKDAINDKIDNKILVENAFKTALNSQSSLFLINSDKFCVLRVDKITDESVKEFTEVRSELQKIWYDQKIISDAKQLLFIAGQNYKSKNNSKIIDLKNVKVTSMTIARDEMKKNIPFAFLQELFNLNKNQFTKPYIDSSNKEVLFAKLNKINLPSADKIHKYRNLYESQIQQIEQEAILIEILYHLRKKYEVKINQKMMNS